jgi:hypothetical protein
MNNESEGVIKNLSSDIKDGGITLVLGSGINTGAGIPCWDELLLEIIALKSSSKRNGLFNNLCPKSPDVLTALKIFEQSEYKNHGGIVKNGDFDKKLRETLYQDYALGCLSATKTLCAIGDVLVHDRSLTKPRIRRVITFNVDSLLEEYLLQFPDKVIPHPITQWYQSAMHFKPSIDIYHLHGFLPSKEYNPKQLQKYHQAADTKVFSDDEYWEMTSRPSSLPNVVMLNALHDSHCIFIGLSMKDPNIARWLALRANEIKASKKTQTGESDGLGKLLNRHYWIEEYTDPLRIAWLKSRGVRTIKLNKWDEFPEKFRPAFGVKTGTK